MLAVSRTPPSILFALLLTEQQKAARDNSVIRTTGCICLPSFSKPNTVKTLAQPDIRLPLYQQLKEMFLFTKEYLDHHSLYETLRTKCGAVLHTAEETIDVAMPNPGQTKALNLRKGQPVMLIRRDTFDPFFERSKLSS
jgi:hypothetical protein